MPTELQILFQQSLQHSHWTPFLTRLHHLAQHNLPEAHCFLGLVHQCGYGVPVDFALARDHYQRAADLDDPIAWNNLGTLYLAGGPNLPPDPDLSRTCYLRAHQLGFPAMHLAD